MTEKTLNYWSTFSKPNYKKKYHNNCFTFSITKLCIIGTHFLKKICLDIDQNDMH